MYEVSKGEERREKGDNVVLAAAQSHASRLETTGIVVARAAKIVIANNEDPENIFLEISK
jgi:hypothetical protein